MSAADERTPLIDPNNRHNRRRPPAPDQEVPSTGIPNVLRQFEDTLQEEEPGADLLDITMKRPAAVIVALSLFVLFLLTVTWVSALKDPAVVNELIKVPTIQPLTAQVVGVHQHHIDTRAQVSVVMDYSNLTNGNMRGVAEILGQKLGSFSVQINEPVYVSACIEAGNEKGDDESIWKHLIQVHVPDKFKIDVRPRSEQEIEINAVLTEAGQTNTLGFVARKLLNNEAVKFKASGAAVVSKYGLSLRLPFTIEDEFRIPQQTSEDLADISKVEITSNKLHGLNITALMNATIGDFPLEGRFPKLDWEVKIIGCDPGKLETLCQGSNMPFHLRSEDEVIDVFFTSILENIPASLVEVCDPKNENSVSPLSAWITAYLAGQTSTFYVKGIANVDQPPILNELVTGFDIPYTVFGKSPMEKLIQSVSLEEVRFSGQSAVVAADTVRFNGKSIVDVVLPRYLEMKTRTAVVVDGVLGNFQLFDSNRRHFAQIIASENWMQTISLVNEDGYKVICFFDDLPTEITDNTAFAEVSRDILLYGKSEVQYDAVVDVRLETTVGVMVVKKVRIKGTTEMRK